MMGVPEIAPGDARREFTLDRFGRPSAGEAESAGHAGHVGVDRHDRFAPERVEKDIGGLATDAREGFERFALAWETTVMAFE